MKAVSLFMDVEDPINPLADDAALDFPLLFTDAGVTGSFCLTGEKCRRLKERGRTDVADAYRPHSLGLHTNIHSFHPTTMELLADLTWHEGCEAAFEMESKGYQAFADLIGRAPAFWGGGGNTWGPEITDAMKRLDIPAYVYALTELPHDAVHKFNGVFALPQALSISESDWADDSLAYASVERVLQRLGEINQPWIGVFVGHPTKFRYRDWWDIPYYHGRTPEVPELGEPLPVEMYERAKKNLRRFLDTIQEHAQVVGIEDVLSMPWASHQPSANEMEYFKERTSANLRGATGWPPHHKDLSAELIVAKTLALADTLECVSL